MYLLPCGHNFITCSEELSITYSTLSSNSHICLFGYIQKNLYSNGSALKWGLKFLMCLLYSFKTEYRCLQLLDIFSHIIREHFRALYPVVIAKLLMRRIKAYFCTANN